MQAYVQCTYVLSELQCACTAHIYSIMHAIPVGRLTTAAPILHVHTFDRYIHDSFFYLHSYQPACHGALSIFST